MINDFDITDVEKAVADAVRTLGVSTNVWNNRPKATSDTIGDFVVVRVTGGLNDKAAYGQCRVSIHLFARDVKEMKNGKKLSVMQKKLYTIPLSIGKYLLNGKPRYVGDTADDFGFHARIISVSVIIKATS